MQSIVDIDPNIQPGGLGTSPAYSQDRSTRDEIGSPLAIAIVAAFVAIADVQRAFRLVEVATLAFICFRLDE
jgi:hypothetical protein